MKCWVLRIKGWGNLHTRETIQKWVENDETSKYDDEASELPLCKSQKRR